MKSLKGHLLVASPKLPDANFYRSVVLMLQHDPQGAFGVVLNRPTALALRDVWNEISSAACQRDDLVNFGGPVSGPLIALHSSLALAESEVIPGVFLSTNREYLDDLVSSDKSPLRVFSGYSGWGRGQLENEIEVGGWLTIPASYDHVFAAPADLWKTVCEEIGKQILLSSCTSRQHRGDPSLN